LLYAEFVRKIPLFHPLRGLLGILCLLPLAVSVYGQGTASGTAALPAGTPNIQKVPLDAVVVFNPEGKRSIYLPEGWPLNVLDEFHHFLLQDQQPAVPFVIQDVSASGKVNGNRIEASATISLTIPSSSVTGGITAASRSVRVPLALREAVIAGNGNITVNDKNWQAFLLADGSGYAVLLTSKESGNAPVALKLELPLWFPIRNNGFSITYPLTASSSFLLQIPETGIEAAVTGNSLLDLKTSETITEIKMTGLRSTTEIRWQKKDTQKTEAGILTVEKAFYAYKLDAASSVCEAVIPVSISAGSISKLQIRLPQETKIDMAATEILSAGNYSVSVPDKDFVTNILLTDKVASQVTLKLKTLQVFKSNETGFTRELNGFEVVGAERQSGSLSVSVPAGMKSSWELSSGIRRTENLPSESKDALKPSGSVLNSTAAFHEFIAQPFSLKVRAALPQTRTNVKAEFQYYVSKGLLQLTGRFGYTVSGSKTDKLWIQMADNRWNVEVGPQGLVDTVNVEQDEKGLLTVPLRNPADGTFTLELRAYRLLSPEKEQGHPPKADAQTNTQPLVLTLPKALVTWNEPAPVVIAAANDVEIQPIDTGSGSKTQQITGLTRISRPSAAHLDIAEGLQQEPLFYLSEPTGGTFAADMIIHRQQAAASIQTEIRPCDEYSYVRETIAYNVAYLPADKLYFQVPKNIESAGSVQIRYGNKTLELSDVSGDDKNNASERWIKKVLQLPEPLFKFQLTLQYSIPKIVLAEGVTESMTQQFVLPVNIPVAEHRVDVTLPQGYRIELPEEQNTEWTAVKDRQMTASDVSAVFRSSEPAERIVFRISVTESDFDSALVAERTWLQTWLTGTLRQDRGTYLLTAKRDSITMRLPPEAAREQRVFVRIDNVPVKAEVSAAGVLSIPLTLQQRNRQIYLEIDYRFDSGTLGNAAVLTPPVFENETVIRYAFWEIILPSQKYIIGFPKDWIPEYRWLWRGFFFKRTASIQKEDAGLTADPADVAAIIAQSNQYLFSSLRPPESVTLYIADRSFLVLSASAAALVAGLFLIYIPQSRYAGSLFALGIALAAVIFYRPAPMLLLLQMSVFGVCLALLAAYIHRIFYKKDVWDTGTLPGWDDGFEPALTPVPKHDSGSAISIEEIKSHESGHLTPIIQ
jgi:hypothetical protein